MKAIKVLFATSFAFVLCAAFHPKIKFDKFKSGTTVTLAAGDGTASCRSAKS